MRFTLTQNSLKQVSEFFKENPQYDMNLLKRATVRMVDQVFCCAGFNESTAACGLINRANPHEHFSTHYIGTALDFMEWCKDAYNLHEAKSKPM